ncbi:MAG: protein kinase family protein [Actinomycetes bacterium]
MEVTDLDGVGHGTILAGRYRLEEQLHAGPRTALWRAVDVMLDRPVGVRVVGGDLAPDALDAARRVSVVEDQRLLRVLDVGDERLPGGRGEVSFVVSEFVEGESLAARLGRGPLRPGAARAVVGEAARALERAAAAGLHHTRLTPASVVLTPDDGVKIVGLGVDATLTADGVDPDDEAAASREDALRLVALLYAALTARWPLGPADGLDAAPQVSGRPVPPGDLVPGVPNDLDTLCAVTFGPHDDGPRTPGELAEQLAPWGRSGGRDAASAERAMRPAGRFPVRLAGTSGAVGAAAAAASAAASAAGLRRGPVDEGVTVGGTSLIFGEREAPLTGTAAAPPPAAPPSTAPGEPDEAGPDERWHRPEDPETERGRRRQGSAALVAVVVLVALGLVFAIASLSTLGGDDREPAAAPQPPATSAPAGQPTAEPTTEAPAATTAPPQIQGAATLDPQGDGSENDDQVARAIDDDPGTTWNTETYTTASLGGLKDGVGLVLDLGRASTLTGLDLSVGGSGGTVEVRTAPGPGLDGSAVVATADLGDAVDVTLEEPVETQFVVLWFTSLPDVGDGYRVELSNLAVR